MNEINKEIEEQKSRSFMEGFNKGYEAGQRAILISVAKGLPKLKLIDIIEELKNSNIL